MVSGLQAVFRRTNELRVTSPYYEGISHRPNLRPSHRNSVCDQHGWHLESQWGTPHGVSPNSGAAFGFLVFCLLVFLNPFGWSELSKCLSNGEEQRWFGNEVAEAPISKVWFIHLLEVRFSFNSSQCSLVWQWRKHMVIATFLSKTTKKISLIKSNT